MNLKNKLRNLGASQLTDIDFGRTMDVSNVNFNLEPAGLSADYSDYNKPVSNGFENYANKQISLNETKKEIIKSASDNYGSSTQDILNNPENYRGKKNKRLTRKAQLAIQGNQTKQQSFRKTYDET